MKKRRVTSQSVPVLHCRVLAVRWRTGTYIRHTVRSTSSIHVLLLECLFFSFSFCMCAVTAMDRSVLVGNAQWVSLVSRLNVLCSCRDGRVYTLHTGAIGSGMGLLERIHPSDLWDRVSERHRVGGESVCILPREQDILFIFFLIF